MLGLVLWWVAFGVVAGLAARWIVPGEAPAGIAGDVALGVLGAIAGGWIYALFVKTGVAGFNVASVLCAVIGAIVLLNVARAVRRR